MRGAVGWALIVCLMVAMAPWMSGGQDTLAMFLGSGALLLGVLLTWRQPAVRGLKAGMLVWSAAGLLGWAALSLAWTANRYSTVVWLVMLVTAILAFRLSYVVAGWQWGRERLLAAYVAVTLAVCAYGYWFYLTVSYERFVSSFYWPNPAAAFLIPGVLVGMFGLRKGGRVAWWWTAYLVVVGTAFALASSRGAALALGVAVLGYVVLRKWSKQAWVRFVCIIAAVVVLSYGLAVWHERIFNGVNTTTLTSRVAEAASGTTQSGSDRIYYLKSAVALWARAPLWGSGAGTYGDLHPQVQQRVVSASVSAHNFYVQTLAELGIVGGLLLIAVLLALMAGLVRGWWRAGELGAPLVLSVVALLIHFGLDMDQRYPAVVVLLAVIVGLVYSQSKETERRIGWPTLALAVLLLPVAISLFMSNTAYHRGQASLSNGDYQEATDEFASASQWPVYDPDAVGAEAIGWFSQGALQPANRAADLALALDRARAAIRQDPTDSQHRQIEARVLALQNDLPGAEAALREALRLDPYNHPDYAWDLSNVYLRMNRPEDAVAVARAMLAQYPISVISNRWVDPSVPVFVGNLWAVVGNVALAKGDLVEARADAIQALTVDRTNLRGRALQVQIDRQR